MEAASVHEPARLQLLYELGCAFSARLDLGELTALVLDECRTVLDAEAAAVLLLDQERSELYFPYAAGEDPEVTSRLAAIRFPADRGIAGEVLQSGRPLRVDDVANDPRFYGGVDQRTGLVTRNLICAPLQSHQGVLGVVQVVNRRGASAFSDHDLQFLDSLAGSIAIAIENARLYAQLKQQLAALERAVHEHNQLIALRRELDVAREIQESILPRVFPPFPDHDEFDIYAAMVPAREVGGDFYDFFLVDARRLGVVIGDVSGKGVPAALFMAMSRTLLKSIALEGLPPHECLQRANRLLCLDNSSETFVSMFYGILDTHTGGLAYCNGGHNAPFVMRPNGGTEVLGTAGGPVLAALPEASYSPGGTRLQPGDTLFLYTDGVTEALSGTGEQFTPDRLRAVLESQASSPAKSMIQKVVHEVRRHSASEPQSDDITALALKFAGTAR